jgi:hypothetical protein
VYKSGVLLGDRTVSHAPAPIPSPPADSHLPIPDPLALRRLIGLRAAELALLRRLLRISDDRARLLITPETKGVDRD